MSKSQVGASTPPCTIIHLAAAPLGWVLRCGYQNMTLQNLEDRYKLKAVLSYKRVILNLCWQYVNVKSGDKIMFTRN